MSKDFEQRVERVLRGEVGKKVTVLICERTPSPFMIEWRQHSGWKDDSKSRLEFQSKPLLYGLSDIPDSFESRF